MKMYLTDSKVSQSFTNIPGCGPHSRLTGPSGKVTASQSLEGEGGGGQGRREGGKKRMEYILLS